MELANQSPKKPMISKAMYYSYLALLYVGLIILIFSILILAVDRGHFDKGMLVLAISLLFTFAASVLMLIMFYRFWDFVIREMQSANLSPSISSPGKAIGYLFIPFYNFYWIFMTYGKLPKNLNTLARSKNLPERIPENSGNILAVLVLIGIIPFVGYVTSAVSAFILLPLFIHKIIQFFEKLPESEEIWTGKKNTEKAKELPTLESIKDHRTVFEYKKHGINYPVGISFLLGLILTQVVWIIGTGAFRPGFFLIFTRYYLPLIISDLIIASVFVLLIHSVRKHLLLFITYGIVFVLLGILQRYVFSLTLMIFPQEMVINPLMITGIINDFIFSAFFMAGLVFSIYYYGIRWWSIIAGLICTYLAGYLLTELIGLTMGSRFFFEFHFIFLNIISLTIQGTLIWVGIRYHAFRKNIAVL